jgi:GH15 family glucan-1,4-alpha-glucosidase
MPSDPAAYLPIAGYGVIGNLRSVALVGRNGSIDWCCFPHMAAPSVFAHLLDARHGGRFRVALASQPIAEQHYLEDTNILCTRWQDDRGALQVTDFMPLSGPLDGSKAPSTQPELHRLLRCEAGIAEVEVEWSPRLDYGRAVTHIEPVPGGFSASAGALQLGLAGLPPHAELVGDTSGPAVRARLRLHAGQELALVTRWGNGAPVARVETSERALRETAAAWRAWLHSAENRGDRSWCGAVHHLVKRSELVLKLLTFAESGAIAAAPTTSLPETLGGVRNWDYRYAWIRDAGLTAQALTNLGHRTEALRFLHWAEETAWTAERSGRALQIMYGLYGEPDLPEEELPGMEGYLGSRPVRVGNGAAEQRQHDIYGELLTAGYELSRAGERLGAPLSGFLQWAADEASRNWEDMDSGLWEIRQECRHYTYSKVLCWAALDRALRMADAGLLKGATARWAEARARIHQAVLTHAYNPEVGAFVQSFGSRALDASNLLIPLHELLPPDDPRAQATIDRTLEQLTDNGLVYRYVVDDGLPGKEGAFGLCTFWLVDALALSGRREEAWRIFEGIARRASPLGLFPQAFTHLGLINSTLYLAYADGRSTPGPSLIGTPEHRREGCTSTRGDVLPAEEGDAR